MTMDVAKSGIDFVIDNARREGAPFAGVHYHGGGEPSVHWGLMTESLAYARERAGDLQVIAASAGNGVFTDRQIDWMIANLNGGMSLSFDGLPEAHDKHRPTVRGTGSSARVMHTMRRFTEADYPYAVRLTVTAEQIPLLPDSIEFVLSNFTPKRVQVEPAYQLGRHEGEPDAETEEFIAAYREAQGRAARFGHELIYSAARVGTLTNHFCGITQDNFCLSPAGNVSACFEAFSEDNEFADVFFYGSPGPGRLHLRHGPARPAARSGRRTPVVLRRVLRQVELRGRLLSQVAGDERPRRVHRVPALPHHQGTGEGPAPHPDRRVGRPHMARRPRRGALRRPRRHA